MKFSTKKLFSIFVHFYIANFAICATIENSYNVSKKISIQRPTVSLINAFYSKRKILCLLECTNIPSCLSCTYSNETPYNCYTYNATLNVTIPGNVTVDVFFKEVDTSITYKNYVDTCTSSIECNPALGLICRSNLNNSCNCPALSSIGICDCPKEKGAETYWNGTHCATAGSLGSPCSADYECQSLTQNTTCVSGLCSNVSNGTASKCDPGWTFVYDACYAFGSKKVKSVDISGYGASEDTGCGRVNATLGAVSKQIEPFFNRTAIGSNYLVDAIYRNATTYVSRDGKWFIIDYMWCTGKSTVLSPSNDCAFWSSSCYSTKACTNTDHNMFCKYIPYVVDPN